ncbi:hypothetical protein N9X45_06125, partial [Pseudomonadales bacterium]|nr:hypothetical protein [Pseudomonadales bacterium]
MHKHSDGLSNGAFPHSQKKLQRDLTEITHYHPRVWKPRCFLNKLWLIQASNDDKNLVGTAGFEPTTTTPPVWCAT